MRILLPYLARWRSAHYSRFHQLMRGAAARGHEVIVLEMPPLRQAQELNLVPVEAPAYNDFATVIELNIPPWLWRRQRGMGKIARKLLFGQYLASSIEQLALDLQIDVALGYNVPHRRALKRFRGVRVFDIADDSAAMAYEEAPPGLKTLARSAVAREVAQAVSAADVAFAVSARLKRVRPAAQLLPNGAPREWANGRGTAPPPGHSPQLVVGYVGAFEYFIDLPAVLDAAAALPTVQFLLVGAGRWLAWLEREVLRRRLRNCELTGPVPYDRVPGLIAQMDVCLCPFRLMPVSHAASPLKFFEYLALSRIVVASRTEELLRVGRSACLFADGAPEIVQTLRGLLDGRTDWEPLVREGARLVLRDHNWDRLCADMLQAIEARL